MSEKVKEQVATEEKVEIKKEEKESLRFELDDKQAEILRQHARALNSYYSGIGAQFCELMENVKQVETIRNNINQLQEDIAKELNMPRGDRINWTLDEKFVDNIIFMTLFFQ